MKKGFTLIELLAVIVVISVLITLTTVSITRTVKNSKNSLYNTQIKSIQSAAEQYGSENLDLMPKADSTNTTIIKYFLLSDIQESGILDTNIKNPKTKKAFTDNDLVIKVTATYITKYKTSKLKYEVITDKDEISTIKTKYNYILVLSLKVGDEVYFDVSTGAACTKSEYESSYNSTIEDYTNSLTGYYQKKYSQTYDNQNDCLKFYVLNTNSSQDLDAIDLILDHNVTVDEVSWSTKANSESGPTVIGGALATATDSWKGTISPRNYTLIQTNSGYIINYRDLLFTARLITAQEIADLVGNTAFDETTSGYSNSFTFDTTKYGWLIDRSSIDCESYGCPNNSDVNTTYGYWTATSAADDYTYAWFVHPEGKLDVNDINIEATPVNIVEQVSALS